MCDKCGNSECCRTVITKQGLQGIQGVVGPPGATGPMGPAGFDVEATNVKTDPGAFGWFKQKISGVLEFFSALGSKSIEINQSTDDIVFSIRETPVAEHTTVDADVTSSLFTIATVDSRTFSYKELHNKMLYFTATVGITGTYTGVTGRFAVNVTLANLPFSFSQSDLLICYFQVDGIPTQELYEARCQVAGTDLIFTKTTFPFTNATDYTISMVVNGVLPIN